MITYVFLLFLLSQDGIKECQFLKTFTRSMLCKQGTTFMPYMPYCLWICGEKIPF